MVTWAEALPIQNLKSTLEIGGLRTMQLLQKRYREGSMANGTGVHADSFPGMKVPDLNTDFQSGEPLVVGPDRNGSSSDFRLPINLPAYARLALEELKCFEVVDRQFEHWGITFTNAIALQPSNPAFFVRPGVTVLMGSPQSGLLEVCFKYPVRFVSALVTSSRRTVLSAYDNEGTLLIQDELIAPNLAGSNSPIPPNSPLIVKAEAISRISFYAFDGQLIVDDFSFGF